MARAHCSIVLLNWFVIGAIDSTLHVIDFTFSDHVASVQAQLPPQTMSPALVRIVQENGRL